MARMFAVRNTAADAHMPGEKSISIRTWSKATRIKAAPTATRPQKKARPAAAQPFIVERGLGLLVLVAEEDDDEGHDAGRRHKAEQPMLETEQPSHTYLPLQRWSPPLALVPAHHLRGDRSRNR